MFPSDIVALYEQGYSIEYIINEYYNYKKRHSKFVTPRRRKCLYVDRVLKNDIRKDVYRIIYTSIKKV